MYVVLRHTDGTVLGPFISERTAAKYIEEFGFGQCDVHPVIHAFVTENGERRRITQRISYPDLKVTEVHSE